ncbi:MAG: T9SS type A sorting domain-containing protein [Brumimicrobium sp.]|nr:T9SS type A sorting domain-containing protein [Brumimicrobium sp.]
MKRLFNPYFLLMVLFVMATSYGFSQRKLVEAEYFIDADPGEGSGISVIASDGNIDNAVESLFKNGISVGAVGLHTFNIRVKDDQGDWGPIFKTVFYAASTLTKRNIKVSQAELFWDADPGEGNGTTVLAFDGNFSDAVEVLAATIYTLPSVGVHTMNIRVKDVQGTWGPIFTSVINITNSMVIRTPKITVAEMFFDSDPGEGNGTTVLAYDGNFNNAIEALTSTIFTLPTVGVHSMGIRVKDAQGIWGPVFTTVLNITSPLVKRNPKVTLAELYWDTDPGEGSGTPLLAFDGNFNDAIEALTVSNLTIPGTGIHTLNVRVSDGSNWGPVFTTLMNITSPLVLRDIKITAGEYFWDTDPGQGNGSPLLAFDGNFNDAIESLSESGGSLPAYGVHLFNVRVKDAQNNWGPVFKTIIDITTPLALRGIKVKKAEFFFDNDPGQGNGNPLLAFDGNFDNVIEDLHQSWAYIPDTGLHVLNVRVEDFNGNWGPTFKTVVKVEPCLAHPTIAITPSSTQLICPGDEVNFSADAGFSSYTWFKGGTIVGTGQTFDADTSGFYRVYAVDNDGCGVFSDFTEVKISYYDASITANGPTTFCQGGNVVLTAASGATSYLWNTGATTQGINVASSGTYVVTVSNGNCLGTDTVNVVVNPNPSTPVITANGATSFCAGGDVDLTCITPAAAYSWSTNEYTQTITASSQGTYTVTIFDANNCKSTSSINVSIFPNPISSVSGNVNICQGDDAQLFVNGGSSYVWSPAVGLSDPTISNPIANPSSSTQYKVVVTGIGGCVDSATVNVFVNPAPIVTASVSATTLCTTESLQLSASPNGATSYVWTGPGGYYSTSQNPMIPSVNSSHNGTFSVTAYYPSGCYTTGSVSVTVNPGPTAYVSANKTDFCVGEDLNLSVLPNGMTYSWVGPNGFMSTDQNPSITGLDGSNDGAYVVTVDNGLCSSTATIQINVAGSISVNASSNLTTLCTGNTLHLTASASGATVFSWTGPNGFTSSQQNPSFVTSSASQSGIYTVVASNTAGCSVSSSVNVTVNPSPTAFASIGSPTICSGEDIELFALPNGLSYAWTGPNGFTSTDQNPVILNATGANQGSYTLVVDNGSCNAISSVSVIVNTSPTITAGVNSSNVCEGSVLSFTATPSGGTSYLWTGPNGFNSSNQNPIINATNANHSGKYVVTVENSFGCKAKDSVTVTVHNAIAPSISANFTDICEGQTLSLVGLPSGMSSYSWVGPNGYTSSSPAPNITGILPTQQGKYFVTMTNGICTATDSIQITVKATPTIFATANDNTLCEGSVLILSATTNSGTSFSWTGPNSFASLDQYPSFASVSMANAGTYSVTTTHPNGCQATDDITIIISPVPNVSIWANSLTLCEDETLKLYSGPDSMYSYDWTGPDGYNISTQNPQLSSLQFAHQGMYVVTVSDSICSASDSLYVTIKSLPEIHATANNTLLCEGSVLNLSASPSGAVSYEWNGPNAFNANTQNTTLTAVIPTNSGDYIVTAYNSDGCYNSDTIAISVVNGIQAIISTDASVCEKTDIELFGLPNGMVSYQWSGPDGFTSSDQDPIIAAVGMAANGIYSLTVSSDVCSSTTNYTVTVKPAPNTSVTQIGSVLNADLNNANYQWVSCDNAFESIVGATSQTYTATENADFAVIIVYDGCVDTSDCYSITGLGLEELSLDGWGIYPNPNNGTFYITANKEAVFELHDMNGKLVAVYDAKTYPQEVKLEVEPGMYFVREKESGETKKVIIK